MKTGHKLFGPISAIGSFIILFAFAVKFGAMGSAFEGMVMLLTGNVDLIPRGETNLLLMIPTILAIVAIELPCTAIAGYSVHKLLKKTSGGHEVAEQIANLKDGHHFFLFFIAVLLEELFARWLFLGALPSMLGLSGPFAFYTLLVIGNAIWALIHLDNFKKKEDRNILRVVPQFIAGFFFSYLFVAYGLLAAILAHFASNAILFAFHKIQRVNTIDVLVVMYAGVCAIVSYVLMEKPLTDALAWLANEPSFTLPGWNFWDYVKFAVFVPAVLTLTHGILLYDRGEVSGKAKQVGVAEFLVMMPIGIAVLFGGYVALGLIISNVPYRIMILAILLAFTHTAASGSAVARTFWASLPSVYIAVCVLNALGLWASIGFVAIQTVLGVPHIILIRYDD